jgi:hypothetical protein
MANQEKNAFFKPMNVRVWLFEIDANCGFEPWQCLSASLSVLGFSKY